MKYICYFYQLVLNELNMYKYIVYGGDGLVAKSCPTHYQISLGYFYSYKY